MDCPSPSTQRLNSLGRFTAAAAAPILLNIVVISVTLLAWYLGLGNTPDTGRFLAYGVTTIRSPGQSPVERVWIP